MTNENNCNEELYVSKIGDVVFYNPQKNGKQRPCFAVVVDFNFFKQHADDKKMLSFKKYARSNSDLVYLFRIPKERNLDGDMDYSLGFAKNHEPEIQFCCSLFDSKEVEKFISHLLCVSCLIAPEASGNVSQISCMIDHLKQMFSEVDKKGQGDALNLYGGFIRYIQTYHDKNRLLVGLGGDMVFPPMRPTPAMVGDGNYCLRH